MNFSENTLEVQTKSCRSVDSVLMKQYSISDTCIKLAEYLKWLIGVNH